MILYWSFLGLSVIITAMRAKILPFYVNLFKKKKQNKQLFKIIKMIELRSSSLN